MLCMCMCIRVENGRYEWMKKNPSPIIVNINVCPNWRLLVASDSMFCVQIWDEELARIAQRHADQCKFAHDCASCRKTSRWGNSQGWGDLGHSHPQSSQQQHTCARHGVNFAIVYSVAFLHLERRRRVIIMYAVLCHPPPLTPGASCTLSGWRWRDERMSFLVSFLCRIRGHTGVNS